MSSVAADEVMVERLRRSLSPDAAVVWDDDDDVDDPAFALLRGLQRDVAADLPQLPSILPREVTSLESRRRGLGRGAAVAAVTAGVLSIAGVAAAQPGRPLSGVRTAVESAVTHVVDAITPSAPVGPTAVQPHRSPSSAASPKSSPRSEAARSAAAAAEVTQALDKAQRFLDRGQTTAAQEQLDRATRALARIADPAVRGPLATRLAALSGRLGTTQPSADSNGSGKDDTGADDHGKSTSGNDSSGKDDSSGSGKTDTTGSPSGKDDGSDRSGRGPDASAVPRPEKSTGDESSHLRGADSGHSVEIDDATTKSSSGGGG
jgi:hypothetical protein